MGLVDDEDFVPVARGLVPHVLPQLPHFIDAAIRSRVDFDYVHRIARRNLDTARAHAARLVRRTFYTVEAAGQNARDRGFARAALSREDVAVCDAVLCDGVLERGFDVLL